jgi:hypothetical protein
LVCANEYFLGEVLCVLGIVDHALYKPVNSGLIKIDQSTKRGVIPPTTSGNQSRFGRGVMFHAGAPRSGLRISAHDQVMTQTHDQSSVR